MIADIFAAFTFSIVLKLFSTMGKTIESIFIAVGCVTLIIAYFCNGNTVNFIGTMDFGIWVLFVVAFHLMLSALEQLLVRKFKK